MRTGLCENSVYGPDVFSSDALDCKDYDILTGSCREE